MTDTTIACLGCGGLVPDIEGPSHRYMLASPGCWAAYTTLLAAPIPGPIPTPHGSLTVDAYAVQHPGVLGPQATQSVWVHLITLQLVLEGGWRPDQAVRLRKLGADASAGWSWLEPPASMGPTTAIDVARAVEAGDDRPGDVIEAWVTRAWTAWTIRHAAVRQVAARLVQDR